MNEQGHQDASSQPPGKTCYPTWACLVNGETETWEWTDAIGSQTLQLPEPELSPELLP